MKKIPPPISLKEAKAYREKLMDERKVFTKDSEKIQGNSYSLCVEEFYTSTSAKANVSVGASTDDVSRISNIYMIGYFTRRRQW